jgi:dTDP-glucose 4,6-dehydratase
MRALVAGGSGFIGSHLSERLLDAGYQVVAIDNLLTGSRDNTAHLLNNPDFELVVDDAINAGRLPGPFDLVMHFASPASPPRYMAHPLETLHAGSSVSEALLEVARRDDARYVYASTSEIYGDPLEHPQRESYLGNVSSIGPRSVYDEAKRYGEALTAAYRRSFGVRTGLVRIFNTYGPRMDPDDGRAIPAFATAALANKPIPVHGDGSQTRSLCYVDDLVTGILALADSDLPGPVNLGNPHEQSLLEIAEIVRDLAGSTSSIEFEPRPVDDPERRQPDITYAREALGWEPRVDVRDGLARTIAWFSSQG